MNCIYQRSKYYTRAKVEPHSIVEPIGCDFLNAQTKPKTSLPKKDSDVKFKYTCEKPLTKQLSVRVLPLHQVERYLKLTQSSQRKNYNLSGPNLEFVTRNLNEPTVSRLKSSFFPLWRDPEFLSFIELLSAMAVLKDNLFSLRDYALSTYLLYYYGQNAYLYNHIQKLLREQFIEYNHEILIHCPQLSRPQLRKIDHNSPSQVQHYISQIMQIGRQKDDLFAGIHLYLSDTLPQKKQPSPVIQQETEYWSFLQFHIAVATGVLADGQHAIIKIGGTFISKTIEYIFLLRLAFHRVFFHKSNLGSPFNNHKYVVCEFFNKDNGRYISKYLLNHYDQILNGKQTVNMVDIKAIYQNDFHMNINDYNNLSPLIKYTRDIFKEFNQNAHLSFYPPKETYIKKIEELKLNASEEHTFTLQRLELMVPYLQKKQQDKKVSLIEKQAVVFDFEAMGQYCRPAPKKTENELFDLSLNQNEDQSLSKYIQRAAVVTKIVKEREKKKKEIIKEAKAKRAEGLEQDLEQQYHYQHFE